MNELTYLLGFTIYLMLDAQEDATILAKKGWVYHYSNWRLRALVAIICAYALYGFSWLALTWCIMMVPYAWIVFDATMGWKLKRDVLYIGETAITDAMLNRISPNKYIKLVIKLLLLTVTLICYNWVK